MRPDDLDDDEREALPCPRCGRVFFHDEECPDFGKPQAGHSGPRTGAGGPVHLEDSPRGAGVRACPTCGKPTT